MFTPILMSCAIAQAPTVDAIDAALARAGAYLMKRQSEDGAWRSDRYGNFKDGWSLSPMALSALYFVPPSADVAASYEKGSDFVATIIGEDGAPRPEALGYPVYALAGATFVLSTPLNRRHIRIRDAVVKHLLAQQLGPEHGWKPEDADYGGWGYFHGTPTRPPDGEERDMLLSSNLSSTVFAIGALRLGGLPFDHPALVAAKHFVERCQNFEGDGGFFFTPSNEVQNKAHVTDEGVTRSYGTMTADGLRALRQLGVPAIHPRRQRAHAWLARRYSPERVPGDYPENREVQRRSSYFYWVWSSSHALWGEGQDTLDSAVGPIVWPMWMAASLLRRQRPDGSFANEYTDLREDDPLVATSFAVAGLALSRLVLTGRMRTSH